MAKRKSADSQIGHITKEDCPKCSNGKLFTNKLGHKWCSRFDCDFHLVRKSPKSKFLVPAHEKLKLRKDKRS